MRLLLDTHVWLWQALDADRISAPVSLALSDPGNELYLSVISVWEFLVLVRKERMVVDGSPMDWARQSLRRSPLHVLQLDLGTVMRSEDLPGLTLVDQADRFIMATALEHELTLMTTDARILDYPEVPTLW